VIPCNVHYISSFKPYWEQSKILDGITKHGKTKNNPNIFSIFMNPWPGCPKFDYIRSYKRIYIKLLLYSKVGQRGHKQISISAFLALELLGYISHAHGISAVTTMGWGKLVQTSKSYITVHTCVPKNNSIFQFSCSCNVTWHYVSKSLWFFFRSILDPTPDLFSKSFFFI